MDKNSWIYNERMRLATQGLNSFTKLLIRLRMINAWCDGDGISFVWNWYNPLTYLMMPYVLLSLLLATILYGVKEVFSSFHDFGFVKSPYWKENQNEIIPITPKDLK